MILAKKPKTVPNVATILSRGVAGPGPAVSAPQALGTDTWESVAIDTEPSVLVVEVLKANDLGETDKVVRFSAIYFHFEVFTAYKVSFIFMYVNIKLLSIGCILKIKRKIYFSGWTAMWSVKGYQNAEGKVRSMSLP